MLRHIMAKKRVQGCAWGYSNNIDLASKPRKCIYLLNAKLIQKLIDYQLKYLCQLNLLTSETIKYRTSSETVL